MIDIKMLNRLRVHLLVLPEPEYLKHDPAHQKATVKFNAELVELKRQLSELKSAHDKTIGNPTAEYKTPAAWLKAIESVRQNYAGIVFKLVRHLQQADSFVSGHNACRRKQHDWLEAEIAKREEELLKPHEGKLSDLQATHLTRTDPKRRDLTLQQKNLAGGDSAFLPSEAMSILDELITDVVRHQGLEPNPGTYFG